MNREFLEGLGLEKEVVDSIMAKHGQSIQSKNTEITTLTTQLADRDADLTALKADKTSDSELQTKLTDLQEKYTNETQALNDKIAKEKLNSSVELALVQAGSKNSKAVKALLDFEALEVSDEGVKGLEDQLKTVVEENPYLFHTEDTSKGQFSKPGNFHTGTKPDVDAKPKDLNEHRITL